MLALSVSGRVHQAEAAQNEQEQSVGSAYRDVDGEEPGTNTSAEILTTCVTSPVGTFWNNVHLLWAKIKKEAAWLVNPPKPKHHTDARKHSHEDPGELVLPAQALGVQKSRGTTPGTPNFSPLNSRNY